MTGTYRALQVVPSGRWIIVDHAGISVGVGMDWPDTSKGAVDAKRTALAMTAAYCAGSEHAQRAIKLALGIEGDQP